MIVGNEPLDALLELEPGGTRLRLRSGGAELSRRALNDLHNSRCCCVPCINRRKPFEIVQIRFPYSVSTVVQIDYLLMVLEMPAIQQI